MKIRYLNGPKAGQIEFVQNQIGNVVVGAGLAEEVDAASTETGKLPKPGSAPVPEPHWEVSVERHSQDSPAWLAIKMTIGPIAPSTGKPGTTCFYAGDPQYANARKEWEGGGCYLNHFGREVPAAILADYTRRWNEYPQLRRVA